MEHVPEGPVKDVLEESKPLLDRPQKLIKSPIVTIGTQSTSTYVGEDEITDDEDDTKKIKHAKADAKKATPNGISGQAADTAMLFSQLWHQRWAELQPPRFQPASFVRPMHTARPMGSSRNGTASLVSLAESKATG